MADERRLSFRIGAQDDASAVFQKIARASKREMGSVQDDLEDSTSKVRLLSQVLDGLADTAEADLDDTRLAAERLDAVLSDDLTFSAREVLREFERMGLSSRDVLDATEDDVRALAAQLERLDTVASKAGDEIGGAGRRAASGLDDMNTSGDQSRSVLANLAGNTAQDLGEVGGVVGTLGVGIGQLAEYAVDGNIALRNLAAVAGPMALLAVGGMALTSIMAEHNKQVQRAREIQEGYTEALLEADSAMAVQSETAKNFFESSVIRDAQDYGANLEVLADAIVNERDAIESLTGPMEEYLTMTAEGGISTSELADAMETFGVAPGPLADELMRLADAGVLNVANFMDLAQELDLLSTEYADSTDDAAAHRAIQEALGTAADDTTDAVANQTAALEENRRALEAQTEAARDALGSQLSLEDAYDRAEDALADYNETVAESGAESEEARRAGNDLLQAYLGVADAAGQSAAEQETAAGRASNAQAANVAAQVFSLQLLAGNLGPGSYLRQQIEDHIRVLQTIPRDITTNVRVNNDAPRAGTTTVNGFRAAGGPVQRNGVYVVGEDGPEVFVPDTAGTVIPNGTPSPADGSGASAMVVNLTVNAGMGADGHDIGNHIVDALTRWVRSNGDLPWAS